MSITRKLPSSGREVVFMDNHVELSPEKKEKKEKVRRLLDEKFGYASCYVNLMQNPLPSNLQARIDCEEAVKYIDKELSLLGIVNH
jgi:hypothetical protein